MRDLTLRQVEVIRALMMTGTISGAAELLNVTSPGVSRLIKHTEDVLGVRLFERKAGLFVPAVEASAIFEQIGRIFKDVENLTVAIASLQAGEDTTLAFASAPSIAQFIAARALRNVRQKFPGLYIDLNILKIEETVDYLLLERGEFVMMSYPVDSAGIENTHLATGTVVAIVPDGHPFAQRESVSVHEIAREPLIGMEPTDPYGRILQTPFSKAGLNVRYAMRGRFAQTVVSLVRHGLGVALIDEFSVAEVYMPGVSRLKLEETTEIGAYMCRKKGRKLSTFAEYTVQQLAKELKAATISRPWENEEPN